jgi:polyferredoxin
MRIVTARRVSQSFFFALFCWLTVVATFGERPWQLRGWPIGLFLDLDPLVATGLALATGTLGGACLWALVTVVLTLVFGRAFCGWVCPFGTLHHAAGRLGRVLGARGSTRYHPAQAFKYYLLAFLLTAAAGDAIKAVAAATQAGALLFAGIAVALGALAVLGLTGVARDRRRAVAYVAIGALAWVLAGRVLPSDDVLTSSLLTGFLDPIPFFHRAADLVLLPLLDRPVGLVFTSPRHVHGGWLIGGLFVAAVLANLWKTRFYCRFVCPLGALLGLLSRVAVFRVARTTETCSMCRKCDASCEGACEPSGAIRTPECVMCMNCIPACDEGTMTVRTAPSAAGEVAAPDLSRRGVVASLAGGFLAVPVIRLGATAATDWHPGLVRPPGAVAEDEFLKRCLRCGRCMRACPTNVLQPAGAEAGVEALWTPVLRNRIGTSGCQLHCVACGEVCPSGAIEPFTLDRKLGRGEHAGEGPIRMGTAFVDRSRCLPFAFDTPCIVCQETCPVSPKAIVLRDVVARRPDGAEILLRQPLVDPSRCNGCGVCEHDCPVSGLRAIRVTAENETRSRDRSLLPGRKRASRPVA